MPGKTLQREKPGCRPSDTQRFRVVFIWMSGPLRNPKVRVLLLGTTGGPAVYEGVKPWSQCKRWLGRLEGIPNPEDELAEVSKTFMRSQFAVIPEAHASLQDLASLGLHRADR